MRRPIAVCVAIIAALAIVCANLWLKLRDERQLNADLLAQMPQDVLLAAAPSQVQPSTAMAEVKAAPPAAGREDESSQLPPPAVPVPPPAAAQIVIPMIRQPTEITAARREGALLQSDQTATARVLAWKDRLALAGHSLTTEQLQALNAAATAQLRRETEESLEAELSARPTDMESVIRMREETLNRQNATNQRILAAVSPQLSEEQTKALRAQFDSGHAARMAAFRSEQEMLRQAQ